MAKRKTRSRTTVRGKRVTRRKTTRKSAAKRATTSLPTYTASTRPLKRQLTLDQEFQIMKIVLDKFLWLGFLIMAFGLYLCLSVSVREGLYYILAGIIILLLFVWIIVKEFEIITK